MSKRSLEKMSLEELQQEQLELAEIRHDLRLRQREVEERIQLEVALKNVSPSARALLAGGVGANGGLN